MIELLNGGRVMLPFFVALEYLKHGIEVLEDFSCLENGEESLFVLKVQ